MVNRPRDQAGLDLMEDCLQQAHGVRSKHEPGWYENWSNYRVESTYDTKYPNKRHPLGGGQMDELAVSPINSLKTPESHQGVNTLRALLLSGLFGSRDYVQADPVGHEDVDAAQRVSKLTMYGLERPGNFRTNFETIGDALIFGLGSYSGRWRQDIRLVPRRVPVPDPTNPTKFLLDPDTGAPMTVLQNFEVPVFDDPVLETDDLFDTWFDPSANRFDQLGWKIKRFRIRGDELRDLRGDAHWDEEGIRDVLESAPGQERAIGPDQTEHPKLLTENLTLEDVKDSAKYGFYGGWIFEGRVPRSTAKKLDVDPRGNVVFRMINGHVVQAVQSSQRSGRIQGGSLTVLPTGRGVYGLSPLSIVRYLQDVSDTQLILTTQALIESVYQNYLTSGDMGPNFARELETRRPREVFTVDGDIDQIAPLPKDYNGLQIAVGSLNLISQTIRNAMNARDPVQGLQSQGDQTATETQIVASAALQNTDQLAVLIERDEMPTMGRLINDLYYVNLGDESKVFKRVGDKETTDVMYYDIDMVSDINFVGARSMLSRAGKANQFRDFATILSSNPFTQAATDWHKFAKRYGDEALDVKGLEDLMLDDPQEIVARMQAAGLAQATGNAVRGGAGADGGAPSKSGRKTPASGGGTGGNSPAQSGGESGG